MWIEDTTESFTNSRIMRIMKNQHVSLERERERDHMENPPHAKIQTSSKNNPRQKRRRQGRKKKQRRTVERRRERRKEARKEAVHLSLLPYFTLDDALSPHDYQKPFKLAP